MNPEYEAWNAALVREYLSTGNAGRLAYLPIDEDELKALAEAEALCPPEEAMRHFVLAVRAELDTRGGSFSRFSAMTGWRKVRDEPPYLAALALTVLAASRMEGDAVIASHNYYAQLNRLLAREGHSGGPPGFDLLRAQWEDLSAWLDEDCGGERGKSTIRQVGRLTHVGFPLSQALIRACDRRRLPDFFRAAGLEPGLEIDQRRLFLLLRAWAAQPSCGMTNRARSTIAQATDVDRDEIAETVARELRAWDGELRDERGRRRGTMHLRLIPRRRRTILQLVARRPKGFPAGPWHTDPGGTLVDLQPHATSDDWYAPLSVAVTAKVLGGGLRLVRDDLALGLDPVDAIPCRQATTELNGGYITSPQAVMWEPLYAIVRSSLAPRLRDFLARWTEGDASGSPVPGIPDGWHITKQFRFTAAPEAVPAEFRRFAPRVLAATSLSGGLPLSRGVYLTGGEPDAHIAIDEKLETTIVLDGEPQAVSGGAITLRLSTLGLAPGAHSLAADVTRSFSTVDTFGVPRPSDAGTVAHLFLRHGSYKAEGDGPGLVEYPLSRGRISVAGAVVLGDAEDLPPAGIEPVLLRAGADEYCVLGASTGAIAAPAHPRSPPWLLYVQLADRYQFVDIPVEFQPVWGLIKARNGARTILRLADHEPSPPEISGAEPQGRWAAAVLAWRDASVAAGDCEAWAGYVRAAEKLHAEDEG